MKSCLIVDPSPVVRTIAGKIVQELGFSVVEADAAPKALQVCQESMPNAVLTEWDLGQESGLSLLNSIKSLPNGEKVAVLFCTAESDMQSIKQALEAGASEYIMKPFDRDIVKSKFALSGLI